MPRRKKSALRKAMEAVYVRGHAAFVANPFWKWNTFWIVAACGGSNMLLNIPDTYLTTHPHIAWIAQQCVYAFALLYKFWRNIDMDLPKKP